MSSAEDVSQPLAAPEAPAAASSEEAASTAPISDSTAAALDAPDAGAKTHSNESGDAAAKAPEDTASDDAKETTEDNAKSTKPRSARERLNSRTREGRPRKKRGGFIALLVIVIFLLAGIGTAVGGFAYLYWFANDDALDFEGTWYVAGTDTPIEITADAIQLTDTVAYRYKLNTQEKTITLTLGNMTGYGSYRFSLDRSQLVIFDGQADPQAVLEGDIRWLVKAWFDDLQNKPNDVTAGIRRNRTLLTRVPGTLAPSDASSSAPQAPEDSSAANDAEEPQTVWSAEEWQNSIENPENGSASSSSSTSSDVNDVNSLLEGINDLPAPVIEPPADDGTAPEDASS